jgi:hypothetical protein
VNFNFILWLGFISNTFLYERTSNLTNEIMSIFLSVSFMSLQAEYSQGKNPWYPRERWDPYDPMLLSEGAFAAGMIFRSVVVSVLPLLKSCKHYYYGIKQINQHSG